MLTDKQKDVVREYYNDGIDPEDIAEEFGYDETDVIDFCSELFIKGGITMDKDKKLYQVTNGCGSFYVIATSFDEAAEAVEERLSNNDYGTFDLRETRDIKLLAVEHFFLEGKQFFSGSNNNLVIVKEE